MTTMNGEYPTASTGSASDLVRARMRELTVSERRAARVLLGVSPMVALASVAQFAEHARVSSPTVLRLTKKLGFKTYGDFQDALRNEIHDRLTLPSDGSARRAMAPQEVLELSGGEYAAGLESTFRDASIEDFQGTLDVLMDLSRGVVYTGGRFSQVLAFYLYALLDRLRPDCRYVNADPALRMRDIVEVRRHDVLVVFDYYPYQQSTVEFALRSAGYTDAMILFTDPWRSPLAERATHVLTASMESPLPGGSLVSGMALVEAVAAGLAARLDLDVRIRIEEHERLLARRHIDKVDLEEEGTGLEEHERLLARRHIDKVDLEEEGTGWSRKPNLGPR